MEKYHHPVVITSKQFINRKKINYKYVIIYDQYIRVDITFFDRSNISAKICIYRAD